MAGSFQRIDLQGPPGTFFAVVYFSRGTLPQKKDKRALLGTLPKNHLAHVSLPIEWMGQKQVRKLLIYH